MLNPSSSSSKKLTKYKNSDFFPREITEEILKRLPVKSLSRFKCVSKPWLSLISSPRFVKIHLLYYSPNFPRIMLLCGKDPYKHLKHCSIMSFISDEPVTERIDYPGKHLPANHQLCHIIGSCNGLLCLDVRPDLFICNPCTGLYKRVPPLIHIDGIGGDLIFGDWAFVYNVVDDDYKFMYFCIKTGELQAYIYSLRANSWKTRVSINSNITPIGKHMFFDGKILISFDGGAYPPVVSDIVSWDMESEVYSMIEQPDYGDGVKSLDMRELGGCLCVVCGEENHADFWVMKEYVVKESWIKILTVNYIDCSHKFATIYPFILPSGEILVTFGEILVTFQAHVSCFVVYNPKDRSMRFLDLDDKYLGKFRKACLYVESLVSPMQYERMGGQED